jgi:hypothetical protein
MNAITERIQKALEALPEKPFLLRDVSKAVDNSMMWKLRNRGYVRAVCKRWVPNKGQVSSTYRAQVYQITSRGLQKRGSI